MRRGATSPVISPGERDGPIVVGAHHDGWFRAAFDNASGVAAMLAIARALPGHRLQAAPPGLLHLADGRGVRAARPRVRLVRRRLAPGARHASAVGRAGALPPLHRRQRQPGPAAPAADAGRAARAGSAGRRERGRRRAGSPRAGCSGPPTTGTEQWPLLVSGVPSVAAFNWETSFARTIYHTPLDTPAVVDFDHLVRLTRFYAYLLLDADRDPDGILDNAARGRQLARRAQALGKRGDALKNAAQGHGRSARGRARVHGRRPGAARDRASTARPDIRTSRPRPTSLPWRRRWRRSPRMTGAPRPASSRRSARMRSHRTSPKRPSRATPIGACASTRTTHGPHTAT